MHFDLGEYAPDRSHTTGPGLRWINNFLPNADGYDTIPAAEATTIDAANDEVRGAATGRSQAGKDWMVYATDVALYFTTGTTWTDVTAAAGAYTTGVSDRWEFTQYGDYIVATNYADTPQLYEVEVDTDFIAASADASRAKVCATISEFVVLGNIVGQGSNAAAIGTQGAGVHWCAIGDPTDWPIVGTGDAVAHQSDFQILEGPGGDITNIVSCGEFAIITRDREIWRMDYVGPPAVFGFRKIDAQRGCHITGSAISVGGRAFFPSRDGFLMCDGFNVKQIGYERIDNKWYDHTNLKYDHMMSVAHVPNWKSVMWAMPSNSTAPTSAFGYNYVLDRWFRMSFNADWILKLLPQGVSLDDAPEATKDMDNVAAPTGLSDVDLDELIGTDQEILGFFATGNKKVKTFTSEDTWLNAECETHDFAAGDEANQRMLVRWFRPWYDGGEGTISVATLGRLYPTDSTAGRLWTSVSMNDYGTIPSRVSGRYIRIWLSTTGELQRFKGFDAAVSTREGRR